MRRVFSHLAMEIPLLLYMLTYFLRSPVFQNLIYEKVCLERLNNESFCRNVSSYHDDHEIHEKANHIYFLSTLTLIIPSIIITLFLGAACDVANIKKALIVPFVGLLFSTVLYIIQSVNIQWNAYLLLISDAIFGICGGYLGIIGALLLREMKVTRGTTMAYGVKSTSEQYRSVRIAMMEGSIGLGGTIGYALSGTLRSAIGYAWSFALHLFLQILGLLYIIVFAKNQNQNVDTMEISNTGKFYKIFSRIVEILAEFLALMRRKRELKLLLWLCLGALCFELLIFAGLTDIQYSFLRYKLGWGDKEYGWFGGLAYATTTTAVLLVYPYLKLRGWSDCLLGSGGIFMKILSLCMLAFVSHPWMAYSVTVLTIGNRFVSTGFRSFISGLVDENEKGKVFSLIVFLEGATSLAATSIYNNLYPKTLSIFPGLMIVFSAVLLLPCLVVLLYSEFVMRKQTHF